MLRNSAVFAGSALLAELFPASLLGAGVPRRQQQAATASADHLAAMRAQKGSVPIHGGVDIASLGGFVAWQSSYMD